MRSKSAFLWPLHSNARILRLWSVPKTRNSPGSQNTIEGNLSGDQEAQQNTRIEHIPAIVPDVSNSTHLPSGVSSTSGLEAGLFDPGFFMPFSLESWPNYEGNFDTNVQQQASLERRPQDLSVRPSPRSHDCARDSSEILQTLNSPVPFTDITAETVLTHFPHILRVNQDAIRRLTELLECPCARKPHLVMLHASMISRIFLWYQHCACANAQRWSEWPKAKSKASSEASNATSVSEDSEPAVIACGMLPAPASSMSADDPTVSIGGYTISDPCVHIVFRDQLIGIELKNLGALIDLFLSRRAGDDAGSVPSLIESLGTWLKTEHARTLKLLKEALRAFNDNIIT
ncbi:hypothetical protein K491DRAFT_335871 [Lophiostoma macrostomum CBS 122681]|uniref:Aflatoxin regulatory protein domain-containing protein n=1 Tax=Lophiostoma macrostomum CBS 122681 TaxID=1314788 RepID=A0A6A6TS16_9PLEO|nr:hypothetical protein K491DRAFT_335871 [Lophiostoma macrostomum CBS 122681]